MFNNLFQGAEDQLKTVLRVLGSLLIVLSIILAVVELYKIYYEKSHSELLIVKVNKIEKIEIDPKLAINLAIGEAFYDNVYLYEMEITLYSDLKTHKKQKEKVWISFDSVKPIKLIFENNKINNIVELSDEQLTINIKKFITKKTYRFSVILEKPSHNINIEGSIEGIEKEASFGLFVNPPNPDKEAKDIPIWVYVILLIVLFLSVVAIWEKITIYFKYKQHISLLELDKFRIPKYKSRFLFKKYLRREFPYLRKDYDMKELLDFIDSLDNKTDNFLKENKKEIRRKIENILLEHRYEDESLSLWFVALVICSMIFVATVIKII